MTWGKGSRICCFYDRWLGYHAGKPNITQIPIHGEHSQFVEITDNIMLSCQVKYILQIGADIIVLTAHMYIHITGLILMTISIITGASIQM
jgi:hypothetical protein